MSLAARFVNQMCVLPGKWKCIDSDIMFMTYGSREAKAEPEVYAIPRSKRHHKSKHSVTSRIFV